MPVVPLFADSSWHPFQLQKIHNDFFIYKESPITKIETAEIIKAERVTTLSNGTPNQNANNFNKTRDEGGE